MTYFGDLLAGQLTCKNRVFCTNRVKSQIVLKNFSVFPHIMCTHLVLAAFPSPKTSIVIHKTFIFFFNPSSIFKKMYELSLIFTLFQVSSPSFLGFSLIKYGVFDVLLSMIYVFCWFYYYNVYSTCFTCLFFIFMHCTMFCVVLCIPCS